MKTTAPIAVEFIADLSSEDISPMFARKAIGILKNQERVHRIRDYPATYEITIKGIKDIEAQLADSKSILHRYMNRSGDSKSSKKLLEKHTYKDEWEPLKIDREAPDYKNAVSAIGEVIETVTGDNGYAATEPEERNHILWSLNEGLEALKDALPSRNQIQALIVAPLNFLARKFAETSMGEVAKIAVAKVLEWLFGLVG